MTSEARASLRQTDETRAGVALPPTIRMQAYSCSYRSRSELGSRTSFGRFVRALTVLVFAETIAARRHLARTLLSPPAGSASCIPITQIDLTAHHDAPRWPGRMPTSRTQALALNLLALNDVGRTLAAGDHDVTIGDRVRVSMWQSLMALPLLRALL